VNGALDPAFDGVGKVRTEFASQSSEGAESVAIQTDGKILVAGWTDIYGSATADDFAPVRYNADGSLDGSFDGDGRVTTDLASSFDYGASVAVQSNRKIVVAGFSDPPGAATADFAVARYNEDGWLARYMPDGGLDARSKAMERS
jgi:serralysin